MRKGKQPQRRVRLPKGWWNRLKSVCRSRWLEHEPKASRPKSHLDIYEMTKISRRAFSAARTKNEMTEALFERLTYEIGYADPESLLRDLGPRHRSPPSTPPTALLLTTQRANPQWADYRDFSVGLVGPWGLRCRILTESPYFRFGFKLLAEGGRLFGDGLINSFEPNLMVHVGRNDWDRHRLAMAASDLFLTAYMSGSAVEDDRLLFSSPETLVLQVELMVDSAYSAILSVDGQECFRRIVPPALCHRVAMYAWGDREEFRVEVTDIALEARNA